MSFLRRAFPLPLVVSLACVSQSVRILPPAIAPETLHARAPDYQQIRVENGGHRGAVYDLKFSPDGALLYSAGEDKVIRVWNTQTGTLSRVLRIPIGLGYEGVISALDVSPDGRFIAVASCQGCQGFWSPADSHLLYLLDAVTGRIAGIGAGHRSPVHSVAFSPDGHLLASGGGDGRIHLWSVGAHALLTPLAELPAHGGPVESLRWFRSGGRLVSGGGDSVAVVWGQHPAGGWYPASVLRGHEDKVHAVDVSADGREILTASADHSLRRWNAEDGASISVEQPCEEPCFPARIRVSPDGTRLAYGTAHAPAGRQGVGTLSLPSAQPSQLASLKDYASALAWSPQGDWIAHSEGAYGKVYLRRSSDLAVERTLGGTGAAIYAVGFTPGGVAWNDTLDHGAWIELDADSLETRIVPEADIGQRYPDGHVRSVKLNVGLGWALINGAPFATPFIYTQVSRARLLSWSSFGRSRVAIGSMVGGLHLIDLAARTQEDCLGHESGVSGVAPLASGEIAFTGSWDQTLRFWDVQDCSERLAFYRDSSGKWAAWTPDGAYLSSDGGERLIGVHRNRGAREMPSFEPLVPERRRADLLQHALGADFVAAPPGFPDAR